jgi:hypothetical protein
MSAIALCITAIAIGIESTTFIMPRDTCRTIKTPIHRRVGFR